MPQLSLPLHPQMLAGLSDGGSRQPGGAPPFPPQMLPPGVARGTSPPGQLAGLRPGGQMQPAGGNPFMGSQNPGAFGTPAPFNPLLAQTLLGQRGGMPGMGSGAPMLPRGPMGAFGLTPERQRPRSAGNPYR